MICWQIWEQDSDFGINPFKKRRRRPRAVYVFGFGSKPSIKRNKGSLNKGERKIVSWLGCEGHTAFKTESRIEVSVSAYPTLKNVWTKSGRLKRRLTGHHGAVVPSRGEEGDGVRAAGRGGRESGAPSIVIVKNCRRFVLWFVRTYSSPRHVSQNNLTRGGE